MVGVKGFARDVALARHRLLVRDVINLGVARHVHLTLVVLEQLAKHLGRGHELRRGVVLVADHQHVMLGKGAVQRRMGFGVDPLVQVEAAHFRAGMRGQRRDRVVHPSVSSGSACLDAASMATRRPLLQC